VSGLRLVDAAFLEEYGHGVFMGPGRCVAADDGYLNGTFPIGCELGHDRGGAEFTLSGNCHWNAKAWRFLTEGWYEPAHGSYPGGRL